MKKNKNIKKIGLIGYPLGHSFSKKYFTEKFKKNNIDDFVYENIEIENLKEFSGFLKNNPDFIGFNITIPHKTTILQYIDYKDKMVEQIGACNTLKISEGKIFGYNTDVYGFEKSFKTKLKAEHKKALILGTGGASKAVEYVLKKLEIPYLFVSRNPKKNNQISYSDIDKNIVLNHQIIINTTPVGSFPDIEKTPKIPFNFITSKHYFYDLIYNPKKTLFLKKAEEKGATTINGLKMLHLQAEKSWKIWIDKN